MNVHRMEAKVHVARFVETPLDRITANVTWVTHFVQIDIPAIPTIVELLSSTIVRQILIQIVLYQFVGKPRVFANLGHSLNISVHSNALQIIVWQIFCLMLASPLQRTILKWTLALFKHVLLVAFLAIACSGITLLR